MSQYFKLFRLPETLIFLAVLSLPTGAFIYACLNGLSAEPQAFALMLVVTITFWLCYVGFLISRKIYLNKITFVTKDGLGIINNGFDVIQEDVEGLTAETILRWNDACKFNRSASAMEGLVIEFKSFPVNPDNRNFGSLAGYLVGGKAVVGYKTDLKTTAFQHELGHAIHHEFTGIWDNEACHNFMKLNNLL